MSMFAAMTLDMIEVNQRLVRTEWNHEEFNPFAKVYYVSDGEGTVRIADKLLILQPQRLYLIPPYMPLKLRCEQHMHHYWVHFTTDRFAGGVLLDLARGHYQAEPTEGVAGVVAVFEDLLQAFRDGSPRQQMRGQALLRLLLAEFLPADAQSIPPQELLEFLPTLEYIENNLDSVLTNDELAALHSWHPTYFANRFSKVLGISPRNYIINKRIEKARQLLWLGQQTISAVAREVGFSDEYYFSRVFKKLTGLPPGRYLKEARSKV